MHTRLNYAFHHSHPALVFSLQGERELASFQIGSALHDSKRVLDDSRPILANMRVALHIHAYHLDIFKQIALSFVATGLWHCDLFVTTDTDSKRDLICDLVAKLDARNSPAFAARTIEVLPNRGRNVFALARTAALHLGSYDYALHIHTKKSLEGGDYGAAWHADLLYKLCGTPLQMEAINTFFEDPNVGVVLPTRYEGIDHFYGWGANYDTANILFQKFLPLSRLNCSLASQPLPLSIDRQSLLVFPPGMMFWFRPVAIMPLLSFVNDPDVYPQEPLAPDGTIAHAVERVICHCCELQGYTWKIIDNLEHPRFCDPSAANYSPPFSVLGPYHSLYEHAVASAFGDLIWRANRKNTGNSFLHLIKSLAARLMRIFLKS